MTTKPTLIYVGDPLCSWCYGYAPEIAYIKDKYKDLLNFKLVMGGLRPYTEEPMDGAMKEMLRHHWEEVNKRSKQPFSYDVLEEDNEVIYDTEPPCRATVAVREMDPDKEFGFFKRVQSAFYNEGKDMNDITTYLELCDEFELDKIQFTELYNSDEIKKATWEDFAFAKDMGVQGFPSTLVLIGETYYMITRGYLEKEYLEEVIDEKVLPMVKQV